jgi:hypothetical protein
MCAMVAPFSIAIATRFFIFDKRLSFLHLAVYLIGSFTILLMTFYTIGFFTFNSQSDLGVAGAYGLYSMNLNSLYNASGFSSILPNFKMVSWHQYESFLYLGFGLILLIFMTLILFINKEKPFHQIKVHYQGINVIPLAVVVVAVTVFALTNVVSINDHILFKIPIPHLFEKLGDIFRASARFFWTPYYLIMAVTIIYVIRNLSRGTSSVLLSFILCVQLYDYNHLMSNQGLSYESNNSPLTEKYWSSLFTNTDNIIFYPPLGTTYLTDQDYRFFSYLAASNKKPIDMGYVARQDNKAVSDFTNQLNEKLDIGEFGDKTIYVSTIALSNRFSIYYQIGSMDCINLDEYLVFFPTNSIPTQVLDTLKKHTLPLPQSLLEKTSFTEFSLSKKGEPGDILSGIDQIRSVEKYITISGWASIKDKTDPAMDSVQLILRSEDNQIYSAKTSMNIRKDVSGHFNNTAMDSTGFYTLAFTDQLKKGSYELAVLITNKKTGKGIYKFINRVNIGYPDHFEVTPFSGTLHPVELSINIDGFDDSATKVKVGGWAAFPNEDAAGCQISLLLKGSDDKIYISPTNNTLRPDVTSYFKNKYNLDESGFDATISKKGLAKGKYQIGVLIYKPGSNKVATYFTDKYMEK